MTAAPILEKARKIIKNLPTFLCLIYFFSLVALSQNTENKDENKTKRFEDFEIRVIRPRYFTKSSRFEISGQGASITNQTFVYTYMLSGILTFHFSEYLALESSASYGFSVDKYDKKKLTSDFDITTSILRTSSILSAGLTWTPVYGKYQMASGKLIYFDTFLTAFGGMNGIDYQFDHCVSTATNPSPSPKTVQYPTFGFGLGQRFYLSRSSSFRWDIKNSVFNYSTIDASCTPNSPNLTNENLQQQNISVHLGYSYFM